MNTICNSLKISPRPADVMITLLRSIGLIEKADGKYHLTTKSQEFLIKDSPLSLVPYFKSLKERPVCIDMLNVLKSGKPASWESKKDGKEWIKAIEKEDVAKEFTAAMDSRGYLKVQQFLDALKSIGARQGTI